MTSITGEILLASCGVEYAGLVGSSTEKSRRTGWTLTTVGLGLPWVTFPVGFASKAAEFEATFAIVFSILPILVSCLVFVTSLGEDELFGTRISEVSLSLLFGLVGLAFALVARLWGMREGTEWVYSDSISAVMIMCRLSTGMTLVLLLRLCHLFIRVSRRSESV